MRRAVSAGCLRRNGAAGRTAAAVEAAAVVVVAAVAEAAEAAAAAVAAEAEAEAVRGMRTSQRTHSQRSTSWRAARGLTWRPSAPCTRSSRYDGTPIRMARATRAWQ